MLFKGKYLIGHVLVFAIVITCLVLGSWQFSRLAERKELNNRIVSSMESDVVKLNSILLPGDKDEVVFDNEYRRVNVTGKYKETGEILILGRSRNTEPGYLVLTPFQVQATPSQSQEQVQDIVYINRGWIPQGLGDGIQDGRISRDVIAPNSGFETNVMISGLVRINEPKILFAQSQQLKEDVTNRIDTNLFIEKASTDSEHMYPLWIQQISETRNGKVTTAENITQDEFPKILDLPELSERNHLSYAIQWVLFGVTAAITWIVICRNAVMVGRKTRAK